MKTNVKYIAIDQYGNKEVLVTDHPRKELLAKLCRKHADKVYVDGEDGEPQHVGYIIAGQWFTLYKVSGRGL